MKVELRQKTVDYNVYIAMDGEEFDTEDECVHHEMILKGERKVCPVCCGKGEISEVFDDEDYHTGAPMVYTNFRKCDKCAGKGYLEKHLVEVWE